MNKCTVCAIDTTSKCERCRIVMCHKCVDKHCDCVYVKNTKWCACMKNGRKVIVLRCVACDKYCTDNLVPLHSRWIKIGTNMEEILSGGDCSNCQQRLCIQCGTTHCKCWFVENFKKCTCYIPYEQHNNEDDILCDGEFELPNDENDGDEADEIDEEYYEDEN